MISGNLESKFFFNRKNIFLFLLTVFFGFETSLAQLVEPLSIRVTPSTQTINYGIQTGLRIQSTGADKCSISGDIFENYNVIKNGNILVRPKQTTEYTFVCLAGTKSSSTKVTVAVNPPVQIQTGGGGVTGSGNSGVSSVGGGSSIGGTGNNYTGGDAAQNYAAQTGNQYNQNRGNNYSSQNLFPEANRLCQKYSEYKSVYGDPTIGAGGGSVPVDLTNLAQVLMFVQKYVQLSANELRATNMIKYCEEYQNYAKASQRLAETSAKELKKIADECYADKPCLLGRIFKTDLEEELKKCADYPVYGREICSEIRSVSSVAIPKYLTRDVDQIQKCQEAYDVGYAPMECVDVMDKVAYIGEVSEAAKQRIYDRQNQFKAEFDKYNGIIGSRPCIKTASGKDPSEVRFYEPDCVEYRTEPALINQEVLKQITALPYTQAFSPSGVLGYDGVIDNINTRVREGNLIDRDISPNFGSTSSGNGPGGTGPGGTGPGGTGTGGVPTDLVGVETNYKQLLSNIKVITTLYDTAKYAYASSTSLCKAIPVRTRADAVKKIEQSKKTYSDYADALTKKWNEAKTKPRENWSSLITQINFDLKDKYNKDEIDKVYKAVQELLNTCRNAAVGTS